VAVLATAAAVFCAFLNFIDPPNEDWRGLYQLLLGIRAYTSEEKKMGDPSSIPFYVNRTEALAAAAAARCGRATIRRLRASRPSAGDIRFT